MLCTTSEGQHDLYSLERNEENALSLLVIPFPNVGEDLERFFGGSALFTNQD
jgi:hypothetical protein